MTMPEQVVSLEAFRQHRRMLPAEGGPRVVAVTGGKGGVGKSFVAVNLAAAWAAGGARTLVVDADFGMADLNLMLGVAPERSVMDLLYGTAIEDVLVRTHGVDLLPGLNGSTTLANMGRPERLAVLAAINSLEGSYDACVIDAPPGIGDTGVDMATVASHIVVVLSPEPVSLADAYACCKAMCIRHELSRAYVVANGVDSADEAAECFERLRAIVDRFLGVELVALPFIRRDAAVTRSCALGRPLVCEQPDSPAARAIKAIAASLGRAEPSASRSAMPLFGSVSRCVGEAGG